MRLDRWDAVAVCGSARHGVVTCGDLDRLGVAETTRRRLASSHRLHRVGRRTFVLPGSPDTWRQRLAICLSELGPNAIVAGRSAARLHGLDGFDDDACEFLLPFGSRGRYRPRVPGAVVHSIRNSPGGAQRIVVDGFKCLRPTATILTATRFDFSRREIENAIDSAIRRRLVSEQRLRTAIVDANWRGVRNGRILVDALIDTGGESALERLFLAVVRRAGLPRPTMRVNVREGSTTLARLDARFGDRLVVELAGHATHSSRQQRQHDEARRTALILKGFIVITFTYNDVRDRPAWVGEQVLAALRLVAA